MKNITIKLVACLLILSAVDHANAQTQEAQQLALNIQKLKQMKTTLTQIKNGYQILRQGYSRIKNISEQDYNEHKGHLDGLKNVSPAVRNYSKVGKIIQYQYQLVSEYRNANDRFISSKSFRPQELEYMSKVYGRLLDESMNNLQELTTILTSGKTSMTDDERFKAIDRIYSDMEEKLNFLKEFNSSATVLALQRKKENNDVKSVETLYGIKF
jgi:DNA repair ATPase RecN